MKWANVFVMLAFAVIHFVQGVVDSRIEHKTFHAVWLWGFLWAAYISKPKEREP